MTDARWAALVLEVPQDLEDELAGLLGQGTLGVEALPVQGDRTRLTFYVGSAREARSLAERSLAERSARGVAREAWLQSLAPVEDLRWAERYQAALRPFPIGERFVVVPGADGTVDPGRTPLYLVPGMAFGTGEHPTTRLCVAALERMVEPGSVWLDLGSGTGILALVASRCGAAHVLARDTDADAVAVATGAIGRNGSEATIRVETGSAGDLAAAGFDGVVANIAAEYFTTRAPELAAVLRPGAVAIVAGFLTGDAPAVEGALTLAGLALLQTEVSDGWSASILRSPPRPDDR